MEKALAAIHQADTRRQTVTFLYGRQEHHIGLYCEAPDHLALQVADVLAAKYPQCEIEEVPDGQTLDPAGDWTCYAAELRLDPELFPILRHAQYEDLLNGTFEDPIDAILKAIRPEHGTWSRVEIAVTPASRRRCRRAKAAVDRLDRPFFRSRPRLARFYAHHILHRGSRPLAQLVGLLATRREPRSTHSLDTSPGRFHEREDDVLAAGDKIGWHLFQVRLRLVVFTRDNDGRVAEVKFRVIKGAIGSFTRSRLATFRMSPIRSGRLRPLDARQGFLLSHEELSTLFHPPTENVGVEKMQTTPFTQLEPPAILASGTDDGEVVIGQVHYRGDSRLFGITRDARQRHLYVIGKTGVGKTTLLANLIATDIERGRGLCLIDPHGDLAESVLRWVPPERTNEVIVFDVADTTFSVPYNPLACCEPRQRDRVTSGVVSAFKKIYDSWGPRLEDTLRNATHAVVEQGGTLLTVMRLLSDASFRERFVERIEDPVVRSFWVHEFAVWNDRYRTEAVAAIQNKIRPFLVNQSLRAIVGQNGSSLDLRRVMDDGKVLIVNLSKGRVGEDNATLLGALLVSSIEQAALSRAEIPEGERRDFYLYLDEFQNFVSRSLATIVSEARKFRAPLLTCAHQTLSQLDDETRAAIFGNVGSMVCFQVGSDDARVLAEQISKFPGQVRPEDLTNLPRYTAYVRLLQDGLPSQPFSMETLPPTSGLMDRLEIVRQTSRRLYARPAERIREQLEREYVAM